MNFRLNKNEPVKLTSANAVYEIMQKILLRESKIDRDREHIWVLALNNANTLLNIELIAMGTVRGVITEPMEVFSVPLQKRAVNIILVHNHPGGKLSPSESDKELTGLMIQCGRILKIGILDHLIITTDSFYSFADSGLLTQLQESIAYVLPYELESTMEAKKKEARKQALKEGEQKGLEKGKAEGLKEGKAEGFMEGEQRGLEKGLLEKAKEMAKLMKEKGYSEEEIKMLTGIG
jgi:DNA repair protein RadC